MVADQSSRDKIAVDLAGVPETMLWPLWSRAAETRRLNSVLYDPMSSDLVDRIDYDFFRRFGIPTAFLAIRARVGDDLIEDYLTRRPNDGVVVALGEGLETQLWRVGRSAARWVSVDVAESIAVRRRLLPAHPNQKLVACSALDPAWMDEVPEGAAPFITAAGLLMYFREADVRRLLTMIRKRFPTAEFFFDTIPPSVSRAAWNGIYLTRHYKSPPMPWGVRIRELPRFIRSIPGWEVIFTKTYGEAFPTRTPVSSAFSRAPNLRRRLSPSLTYIRGDGARL